MLVPCWGILAISDLFFLSEKTENHNAPRVNNLKLTAFACPPRNWKWEAQVSLPWSSANPCALQLKPSWLAPHFLQSTILLASYEAGLFAESEPTWLWCSLQPLFMLFPPPEYISSRGSWNFTHSLRPSSSPPSAFLWSSWMKEFPAQDLVLSNTSKWSLKNEQMNGQMEWTDDRNTDNLSLYFPLSYLSFKMCQAQPKRKNERKKRKTTKNSRD